MRAKAQSERAAEQRQESPEEYAQTEVQQGISDVVAHTGNTAKSTARMSYRKFLAMQEKRKNLTLQGSTQSASKPTEKRKSLFQRRPSAGKCSKAAFPAKGHLSQNTSAASPCVAIGHTSTAALPSPNAAALKAAAPEPRGCAPLSAKADGCHSGGQYRSHRYPRTQAAHNQQ
ncbi:hypothetical protein NIA69_06430 [Gemmiger formicilis]|nr:hypothetical protein [Gemmiger formicilis]